MNAECEALLTEQAEARAKAAAARIESVTDDLMFRANAIEMSQLIGQAMDGCNGDAILLRMAHAMTTYGDERWTAVYELFELVESEIKPAFAAKAKTIVEGEMQTQLLAKEYAKVESLVDSFVVEYDDALAEHYAAAGHDPATWDEIEPATAFTKDAIEAEHEAVFQLWVEYLTELYHNGELPALEGF